jgi:hypothetical protein
MLKLHTDLGTQPLTATFYLCKYSPMPLAYASCDIDAFVEFLHVRHEHQAKSKEDNYLFSPAIFDPNKSTGKNRGKENILHHWLSKITSTPESLRALTSTRVTAELPSWRIWSRAQSNAASLSGAAMTQSQDPLIRVQT